MKNLKRALAVVIALTMVMSTVAFAATFSDVETGADYAKAISLGTALNLFTGYEDGTFKPTGDITRAEFAAIVVRTLGQESQADGAKDSTKFTDVPSTHWAAGYINIASSNGIVNGYGDGKFGPEDKVTYEQAVKMMVVALGYSPAVGSAGYPVGYLTIAQQNGMTTGVKGTNGVAINRGQVAQLVFNSLDVPLMEQTGFGTYVDYIVQDGSGDTYEKTLMSEKLGVVKLKAMVTKSYAFSSTKKESLVSTDVSNSYNSKYDDTDYGDVTFENKTWDIDAGKTNLKNFVGSTVTLYIAYDENSDDDPIALYVEKYSSNGTDEVTFNSDNVEGVTVASGIATVEYYENDSSTKTTDFTIANSANIYVNGYLTAEATDTTDLTVQEALTAAKINVDEHFYGSVTFALNDEENTDEDYDTVYITQYNNIIVDTVNTTSGKVSGKDSSGSIIFKETNTDNSSTLVDKDGKTLDWSTLKENDILSVKQVKKAASNDVSVNVNVCTLVQDVVTGSISEVSGDTSVNADAEFTISGNTYKVDGQNVQADDLALEDEGSFYLDIMGNIAYVDTKSTVTNNYAYVIDTGTDGLDETTQIKMFSYAGEMVTLNTASTVRVSYTNTIADSNFDGVTNASDYAVGEYVSESVNTKELLKAQIGVTGNMQANPYIVKSDEFVTFGVNSSGVINKIGFADASAEGDSDAKNFTLYAKNINANDTTSYRQSTSTISVQSTPVVGTPDTSKAYITENTIIMVAPSTLKAGVDDEDYELIALSALEDDYDGWKQVSVYDVNDDLEAGVVLVNDDASIDLTTSTVALAVAVKTATSKNSDGDSINKITALQSGASTVFDTVDDNVVAANGTVFIPEKNVKGELKTVKTLASPNDTTNALVPIAGLAAAGNDDVDYYAGQVTRRDGSKVDLLSGDNFLIPSGANIYVYDERASKDITKVTVGDDFGIFDVESPSAGTYTYTDDEGDALSSVSIFVREYNGKVADVVIYLFK